MFFNIAVAELVNGEKYTLLNCVYLFYIIILNYVRLGNLPTKELDLAHGDRD